MALKSWQIFVFSLIPLALVFVGVVAASYRGIDSEAEVFGTPAPTTPAPTTSGASPTAGPGGGENVLLIAAKGLLFDKRTLTAPAQTEVTIRFNNQDAGVIHNVAVYTNRSARTKIFVGELFAGPKAVDYKLTTPGPGSYFFRCDVHPDTMTGTFAVK